MVKWIGCNIDSYKMTINEGIFKQSNFRQTTWSHQWYDIEIQSQLMFFQEFMTKSISKWWEKPGKYQRNVRGSLNILGNVLQSIKIKELRSPKIVRLQESLEMN